MACGASKKEGKDWRGPGDVSCGRWGAPYFRKYLHPKFPRCISYKNSQIGKLLCSRCPPRNVFEGKFSSGLASLLWGSPSSFYLCGEGEVYMHKKGRGKKSGSGCRKGWLFNSKREFRQLAKKGGWLTSATWLCFFPEVYLLWCSNPRYNHSFPKLCSLSY